MRQVILARSIETARKAIPDAIRQAWSIVVTVNEHNDIQAFKATVGGEPLFATVKADKRARIQETAISAEAMLPGGPYIYGAKTSRRAGSRIWSALLPRTPNCRRCCGRRRSSTRSTTACAAASLSLR
jgi:hypothetical protein